MTEYNAQQEETDMVWNGRTVFVDADSGGKPETASDAASQMIAARRRHNHAVRVQAARERGLIHEASTSYSKQDVEAAAQELLGQMKAGRITRQHVEGEQRADMDRLAGWRVAQPAIGTALAEKVTAVEYRVAVRALALQQFEKFELATLISTSARPGRQVTSPVARKPWRPGAASGARVY